MLYLSYSPSAPLRHFVERMWLIWGGQETRRECILPNGTIELVINLLHDRVRIDRTEQATQVQTFSGAVVSGTYSSAFAIDAIQHAAMMGVHFRPAGAYAVLGVPLTEFANKHTDLAALWGDNTSSVSWSIDFGRIDSCILSSHSRSIHLGLTGSEPQSKTSHDRAA